MQQFGFRMKFPKSIYFSHKVTIFTSQWGKMISMQLCDIILVIRKYCILILPHHHHYHYPSL